MDNNNMITIDAHHYEELVRDSERLDLVKNLLISNIRLDYRGEDLRIDDEIVFTALSLIDAYELRQIEQKLREQWKKEHEEEEES